MGVPEVGDKLGRYRLLELVGQGGMASVYRAQDEDLGREVAIKILHPHLQGRPDARQRFRREARTVARIEHPNIVGIFDTSGEDSDTSFIVTQFIHGPHLRKLLDARGPFPPHLCAAMARQVAEGLLTAHRAGIVHRDVKPENILVSGDGLLKVADFGIAHLVDTQDMTATGQILGSPYYMSPEQIQGKKLDARADLFSFGTLLYLLVTGRQAFEGANPHAVLRRICEGEIDPPERLAPQAGQAMADLIRTCLAKDRDSRPSGLEPVAQRLDLFMERSGVLDPVTEVKDFLADADAYRKRSRARAIDSLVLAGERLTAGGEASEALDAYNMVLAMDPEHPRALAAVQDVASARSRRRLLTRLGALLGGLAVVAAAILGGPRLMALVGTSGRHMQPEQDAFALDGPVVPAPGIEGPMTGPGLSTGPGPGKDDPALPGTKLPGIRLPKKITEKPLFPAGSGKATVKFVPMPKTVVIWVDGEKLGDYFKHQTVELSVGEHLIRFEPEDPDCCEPAEWTVKVLPAQPDGKAQSIGRRLSYKPATLMVVTDKPSSVQIDGSFVGKAGTLIPVPMKGNHVREIALTVEAEGYETIKKKVTLQAGKALSLPLIKLQPLATG